LITLYNLSAGIHTLTIWDSCGYKSEPFTIGNGNKLALVNIAAADIQIHCSGKIKAGYIVFTATGGSGDYGYSINDGTQWTQFRYGVTDTIPIMLSGSYLVQIRDEQDPTCTFDAYRIEVDINFECDIVLDLKIFLEGVITQTSPSTPAFMTNHIQEKIFPFMLDLKLPQINPYTLYGATETYYQIINPAGPAGKVVDWVLVEIWGNITGTYPMLSYSLLDVRAMLLQPDGSVVDTSGQKPRCKLESSTDVYVVVKHRNHLSVVSSKQFPYNENITYDFSDTTRTSTDATGTSMAMKAFACAQHPMIVKNGKACLWAGDLNMTHTVDNMDASIFATESRSMIAGEYILSDINMNGIVTTADESFVSHNSKITLYSATRFFQKKP
jgi:hypothetical protein